MTTILILRMMVMAMTTMMIVVLDLEVSILLEVVEENVMNLIVLEIHSFCSYVMGTSNITR
jgi:hypothetical protein